MTFDPAYRDVLLADSADTGPSVVVLPYDSRDQVTSGVLVEAIAAGRPVVATAFPHAVELLSSGAGMVVPHGDATLAALRCTSSSPIPVAPRPWLARPPYHSRFQLAGNWQPVRRPGREPLFDPGLYTLDLPAAHFEHLATHERPGRHFRAR